MANILPPKKPKRGELPVWTYRAPRELDARLLKLKAREKRNKNDVSVGLLGIALDALDQTAEVSEYLQFLADEEGVSIGVIIGRLAAELAHQRAATSKALVKKTP